MQRTTAITTLVVIVALTVILVTTLVAYAADSQLGVAWSILVLLLVGIVAYKSIYRIQGETMLLVFLMSTYIKPLASGSAKQSFEHESLPPEIHKQIKTSTFLGLPDLAFYLWPIYTGVLAPLHTLQIHFDRVSVLTKKEGDSAQTLLMVDSTVYMRLSPLYVIHLLVGLGLTELLNKGNQNLAKKESIDYQGVNENGQAEEMSYTESCIAKYLKSVLQNAVHDGIREAAGDLLWEHVANNQPEFRTAVMKYVAEDHLFQQAGMLKFVNEKATNGSCVTNFEFKVERIGIGPELQTAIQGVRIATLNADADKKKGEGEKDEMRKLMETGCSAEQALAYLTMRDMPEGVSMVVSDGDLMTTGINRFLGNQTNKPKKDTE